MSVTYSFQIGETVRIPLLVSEGDRTSVSGLRANLKLTKGNKQIPELSTPSAAVFEVIEASEGWILEVPAQTTAVLKPGMYVVNAAMEVNGQTLITDPSYVRLEPSTTI